MNADIGFVLTADYFNHKIVQFEPLIEHWSCKAAVRIITSFELLI
jgi:hypothetical protein